MQSLTSTRSKVIRPTPGVLPSGALRTVSGLKVEKNDIGIKVKTSTTRAHDVAGAMDLVVLPERVRIPKSPRASSALRRGSVRGRSAIGGGPCHVLAAVLVLGQGLPAREVPVVVSAERAAAFVLRIV